MRLRGVLAIIMSIAGAISATPVRALTFDLTFAGMRGSDISVAGGGFFSVPDQASIRLQDLTAFFFTWSVSGDGDPVPFSVGLPDLLSFSATVSGTTVTSLALSTKFVASPGGVFNPERFEVNSLAPGGAFATPDPDDGPTPSGAVGAVAVAIRVETPAPVPEPASLVLFASGLLGMGLVGLARRRR